MGKAERTHQRPVETLDEETHVPVSSTSSEDLFPLMVGLRMNDHTPRKNTVVPPTERWQTLLFCGDLGTMVNGT